MYNLMMADISTETCRC